MFGVKDPILREPRFRSCSLQVFLHRQKPLLNKVIPSFMLLKPMDTLLHVFVNSCPRSTNSHILIHLKSSEKLWSSLLGGMFYDP